MRNKFFIAFLLCLTICVNCFGQGAFNAPNINPPSPVAAAFGRYAEIPVSYNTGVPNIDIPIHTLKSGGIQLPVTISYHAGGIKVQDVASEVGLGWVLNFGGMIGITEQGLQDGMPKSFKTSAEIDAYKLTHTTLEIIEELDRLNSGSEFDTQSDRYTYNFNGHAGVFSKDFVTGQIKTIPYAPLKITEQVYGFKIIAEDGTQYLFGDAIYSAGHASGLYISKIISADNKDTIHYVYSNGETFYTTSYTHTLTVGNDVNWVEQNGVCCTINQNYQFIENKAPNQISNTTKRLDRIISRSGTIEFSYLNDRQDIRQTRLQKIKILNTDGKIIKQFNLVQSYFESADANSKRLRLDELQTVEPSGSVVSERHQFIYNSLALPSWYKASTWQTQLFSEDYWGYFNSAYSQGQFPTPYLNQTSTIGGSRGPNATSMKACVLQEIIYPTGGKTVFEFEANNVGAAQAPYLYDYTSVSDGVIGGLRIKTITNYASPGATASVKTFKYGLGRFHPIIQANFRYTQPYLFVHDLGFSATANREMYVARSIYPITIDESNSISYSRVEEYMGTEATNIGKTVYDYYVPSYSVPQWDLWSRPKGVEGFNFDHGHNDPELLEQTFYRNEGGVYKKVKSTINTYNDFNQVEYNTGLRIDRSVTGVCRGARTACYLNDWDYIGEFMYGDTKGYQDVRLLAQTAEYNYMDDTRILTNVSDFTYDATTLLLKTKTVTNSKGEAVSTEMKYPIDFVAQAPYNTMVNRNELTPLVEQSTFNNAVFLQSVKTNYSDWGNGFIAPATVESKTASNSPEIRLRYYGYDISTGNILTVSKENDLKNSYVWGYHKMYPVASIVNAEVKDIFHTSFEEGDGNSNPGDSKTGDRSETNGFTKSLSNLTNGNYILSWWQKSGADWTLQKSTLVVSNGTYTINLAGQVDEVRFYPEKALMTTYTYAPLVGVTSQCDANNRVVYYQYDAFNRLVIIRDHDRNILKKICYNYHGQVENCQQNLSPLWVSTGSYGCETDGGGQNTGYQQREEIDQNPFSPTYGQTQWVTDSYNEAACPIPCNYSICNSWGEAYTCIGGQCEQGIKVYTYSYYDQWTGMYECTYHYEYSGGSWSQDYTEYGYSPCF